MSDPRILNYNSCEKCGGLGIVEINVIDNDGIPKKIIFYCSNYWVWICKTFPDLNLAALTLEQLENPKESN